MQFASLKRTGLNWILTTEFVNVLKDSQPARSPPQCEHGDYDHNYESGDNASTPNDRRRLESTQLRLRRALGFHARTQANGVVFWTLQLCSSGRPPILGKGRTNTLLKKGLCVPNVFVIQAWVVF